MSKRRNAGHGSHAVRILVRLPCLRTLGSAWRSRHRAHLLLRQRPGRAKGRDGLVYRRLQTSAARLRADAPDFRRRDARPGGRDPARRRTVVAIGPTCPGHGVVRPTAMKVDPVHVVSRPAVQRHDAAAGGVDVDDRRYRSPTDDVHPDRLPDPDADPGKTYGLFRGAARERDASCGDMSRRRDGAGRRRPSGTVPAGTAGAGGQRKPQTRYDADPVHPQTPLQSHCFRISVGIPQTGFGADRCGRFSLRGCSSPVLRYRWLRRAPHGRPCRRRPIRNRCS